MISKLFIKYKVWFKKTPLSILRNQNGVTAVLVAIVAAMLLGFTALAIDVGYMYSTRNELQNVADAAALAGAGELGRIYLEFGSAIPDDFDIDDDDPGTAPTYRDRIEDAAKNTALQNKAAGLEVIICPEAGTCNDILIGTWDWEWKETAGLTLNDALENYDPGLVSPLEPDAVRVIVMRTSVATFFGKIFSFFGGSADTFQASAVATAALSGPATVGEGELITPVGVSENFFGGEVEDYCLTKIEFSPTAGSCAGWHNFYDAVNAADIAAKLIGFIEEYGSTKDEDGNIIEPPGEGHKWLDDYFDIKKDVIPEATAGTNPDEDTVFEFQGGQISSLFLGGYYEEWKPDPFPPTPLPFLPLPLVPVDTEPVTPLTTDPFGNAAKPAPFFTLFDFFRFRDGDNVGVDSDDKPVILDEIVTCDGIKHPDDVWTATVPVYKEENTDCTNPNTSTKIVGYAKIQILMPFGPPDTNIQACVDCTLQYIEARGGGAIYGGIRASIPNLVQ